MGVCGEQTVGEGFALNSVCGDHRVTCSVHNDWFLKNEKQEFWKIKIQNALGRCYLVNHISPWPWNGA